MSKTRKNTVIVVLGMHRSGTSAITRSLNLLGVGLGNDLHPAGFDNPKGFWEDVEVLSINNELLAHQGSAYDRLGLAQHFALSGMVADELKSRAARLVTERLHGNGGLWGVKDPRMCRLLPFWQDVFDSLGCETKYVIASRNPKSVASSLVTRNSLPPEKSYFLWLQHMLPAIMETSGSPRLVIDYDLFIESPLAQVERMSSILKLPLPDRESSAFSEFFEDFLDKCLRHTKFSIRDLESDPHVPADVTALYKLLLNAASDETDLMVTSNWEVVRELCNRLEAFAPAFSYANSLEDERASLYEAIWKCDSRVVSQSQTVAERDGQIASLNRAVAERDGQIASLNRAVAERDTELLAERARLLSIAQSNSWRITLPLRELRRWISSPAIQARRYARVFLGFSKRLYRGLPLSPQARATHRKLLARYLPWLIPYVPSQFVSRYSAGEPQYVPRLTLDAEPVKKAVRVIAFYLPQFHPIPENDAWWGKGFTEWTNVRPATPQFERHYQPHVPDDFLGYYNLLDREVQARQIELAKQYGIEGFCFYLYWFSGKRLLEQPVDNYLNDPTLDLRFCVCWANENWSRRWDGLDHDLLMVQNYSNQDDIDFISNIAKYLRDPRYIRIDGMPLLLVYRPNLFPDMKATAKRWRDWCRANGIGEIYLAYPQSFECVDPAIYGFDAAVEFPPNNSSPPDISNSVTPIVENFHSTVYDWRVFVERSESYQNPGYKLFRGVCPSWDNTARKKNKGTVFHNSRPKLFTQWLTNAFVDTRQRIQNPDEQIVFINAWNEWAEGAHLEPDKRHGFAWLQSVRDAHRVALKKTKRIIVVSHDAHPHGAQILCLNFARYFREQLHFEVEMIVLGEGVLIPKYQEYATVHQLNLAQADKQAVDGLLASLRNKGAEVAIVNTTVSGQLVPYLKEHGFAVVSLVHEMPGILESYKLEEHASRIAAQADKVVFPARQVQEGFEAFIGKALPQAVIRPQGLYLRSLLREGGGKQAIRTSVRKKLGLPENARIILCVGYADHRKGFDLFVLACMKVMQSVPDTYALWVGHLDQKFVDQAMKPAAAEGLRDRFLFTGLLDHPQEYYLAADIYALTSREDPFPSVVMEALDALTPVVAFKDCGGFENLLKRGCGILVPAGGGHAAFADALAELLQDPQRARALAETGRNIVENELSFRHYLFDLLEYAGWPMPKVSVVVPNYKYEKYIRQRLETVVNQTYPIFELIVLDDCSPDNSVPIIQDFLKACEVPHRLEINEHNSGSVFRQWRKGLEMARGEYVWIAEADDICKPEFLETLIESVREADAALGFCDSWQIDENGNLLGDSYKPYVNEETPGAFDHSFVMDGREFLEKRLAIKNVILNVSGVVFRREALLAAMNTIGDELAQYKVAGDWRIYIEICARDTKIVYCADALNGHCRHQASVTHVLNAQRHLEEIETMQKISDRVLGSNAATSAKMQYRRQVEKQLLNRSG